MMVSPLRSISRRWSADWAVQTTGMTTRPARDSASNEYLFILNSKDRGNVWLVRGMSVNEQVDGRTRGFIRRRAHRDAINGAQISESMSGHLRQLLML